jgi:hypothetical protein
MRNYNTIVHALCFARRLPWHLRVLKHVMCAPLWILVGVQYITDKFKK